jgi:hypothetical protein
MSIISRRYKDRSTGVYILIPNANMFGSVRDA